MIAALFASVLVASGSPDPVAEAPPLEVEAASTESAVESAGSAVVVGGESLPMLGMVVDLGVPSGLGISAVVRPLPWLRGHGGFAHNGAGFGIRGGVGLVPFQWVVSPALNLQLGHFFEGDATGAVKKFIVVPDFGDEALQRLHYTYFNAHVGLEVGSPSGFSFFLRGGPSWFKSRIHGLEKAMNRNADGVSYTAVDPNLSGVIPSAELGCTLYFL